MLAQIPAVMSKVFMDTLKALCLTLTAEGLLVLVPGQSEVRLVYTVEEEQKTQVTISGIPLNGTQERSFTLLPKGQHLVVQGFGEEEADIDLYLNAATGGQLSAAANSDLQKLNKSDQLSFMGADFQLPT